MIKFFIMLGRGILKKTVFGNCFLMTLSKSPEDRANNNTIPTMKQVVTFLQQPKNKRLKDTDFIARFFAKK
jgi:hypothetical protein